MDELNETRQRHNANVSIYADLLSKALANWDGELDAEALFDHVLDCRIEMLRATHLPSDDAYLTLAREISYDRALIKLCATFDVDAKAVDFAHPGEERGRLERELAERGVNLAELSREHPH